MTVALLVTTTTSVFSNDNLLTYWVTDLLWHPKATQSQHVFTFYLVRRRPLSESFYAVVCLCVLGSGLKGQGLVIEAQNRVNNHGQ